MNYKRENRKTIFAAIAASLAVSAIAISLISLIPTETGEDIGFLKLSLTIAASTLIAGIVAVLLVRKYGSQHAQAASRAVVLEKQIEHILDATQTGLNIIDQEHNIRFVDPQSRKTYGDPSGKKCYEYFMGRPTPCANCMLERAIKSQSSSTMEIVMPTQNNRPVQIKTIPFRGEDGRWLAAEVHVDITDRMNAEMSLLRAYEELKELESIIYRSPVIIITWKYEPGWPVTYVSRNVEKYGYTQEEITSGTYGTASIVHPQDLPEMQADVARHIANRASEYKQIYRAFTKSGEIRWMEDNARIIYGDNWKVQYIQGILFDITEKRQAEDDLRRYRDNLEATISERTAELVRTNQELNREIADRKIAEDSLSRTEKRFHALFENTALGIIISDTRGKFLDANAATGRILGYGHEELKQLDLAKITHPDDIAITEKMLSDIASNPTESYAMEKRYLHKDGKTIWCQVQATLVKDSGGNFIIGAIIDITDRKIAQIAMRTSEASYREIFEAASDAIIVLDMDGTILDINKRMLQLHGSSFDEMHGKDLALLCTEPPPYSPDDARKLIERAKLQGPQRFVWKTAGKNGKIIWAEVTLKQAMLTGKSKILIFARDITDRKIAQEAIKENEARYRTLFNVSPDAICIIDAFEKRIVETNEKAMAMYGYSQQEFFDLTLRDISDELEQTLRSAIDEVNKSGGGKAFMSYHRKKNGEVFPVEIVIAQLKIGEKSLLHAVIRDMTDQMQAENALHKTEEKYRTLAEAARDMIFLVGPDEKIKYVNRFAAESYNLRPGDMIGKDSKLFLPTTSDKDSAGALSSVFSNGTPRYAESVLSLPDGNRWIGAWLTPIQDHSGKTESVLGIARDITDRITAQQMIQKERDFAKRLVDTANVVVVVMNRHGIITELNQFGQSLIETKSEDIVGKDWGQVFVGQSNPEDTAMNIANVLSKKISSIDTEFPTPSGKNLIIRWFFSTLDDANVHTDSILAIGHDITDLMQQEQQLRQSMKMDAIGRLAGGIAHDFNNQLTIIKGYCELLLTDIAKDNPILDQIKEINDAATRAGELTSQLLAFGRNQKLKPTRIDVNTVIAGMGALLKRIIGDKVTIAINSDNTPCTVIADSNQLQQALINLIINARDAMPTGNIKIKTHATITDANWATANDLPQGKYVTISVSDTGVGMDAKTRSQIFEPFFTTKPAGKGTGLGLAMVYGFVKRSGGCIEVDSVVQKGSTFRIFLPEVADRD